MSTPGRTRGSVARSVTLFESPMRVKYKKLLGELSPSVRQTNEIKFEEFDEHYGALFKGKGPQTPARRLAHFRSLGNSKGKGTVNAERVIDSILAADASADGTRQQRGLSGVDTKGFDQAVCMGEFRVGIKGCKQLVGAHACYLMMKTTLHAVHSEDKQYGATEPQKGDTDPLFRVKFKVEDLARVKMCVFTLVDKDAGREVASIAVSPTKFKGDAGNVRAEWTDSGPEAPTLRIAYIKRYFLGGVPVKRPNGGERAPPDAIDKETPPTTMDQGREAMQQPQTEQKKPQKTAGEQKKKKMQHQHQQKHQHQRSAVDQNFVPPCEVVVESAPAPESGLQKPHGVSCTSRLWMLVCAGVYTVLCTSATQFVMLIPSAELFVLGALLLLHITRCTGLALFSTKSTRDSIQLLSAATIAALQPFLLLPLFSIARNFHLKHNIFHVRPDVVWLLIVAMVAVESRRVFNAKGAVSSTCETSNATLGLSTAFMLVSFVLWYEQAWSLLFLGSVGWFTGLVFTEVSDIGHAIFFVSLLITFMELFSSKQPIFI